VEKTGATPAANAGLTATKEPTGPMNGIRRIAVEELAAYLQVSEGEESDGVAASPAEAKPAAPHAAHETLEQVLAEGPVELLRGGVAIAEVRAVRPAEPEEGEPVPVPDFLARMRAVWGDSALPQGTTAQWIREDRDGF